MNCLVRSNVDVVTSLRGTPDKIFSVLGLAS